jgi:hypothetical protein
MDEGILKHNTQLPIVSKTIFQSVNHYLYGVRVKS